MTCFMGNWTWLWLLSLLLLMSYHRCLMMTVDDDIWCMGAVSHIYGELGGGRDESDSC